MSKLGTVWNYIRQHKYLITVVLFLIVIVFLDENSLIQRAKHRREINALTSEIEKYRKQYEEDTEKLKELTNQSTRDFIRNMRLQAAAKLLAEKRHSVAEVAGLTGFANVTYFTSAFKDLYGVPPTVYMEQHASSESEA